MGKNTYVVTGEVTISVHTEVKADSEEEAKAIAYERGLVGLCWQCSGSRTEHLEWCTSGELDGEVKNMRIDQ